MSWKSYVAGGVIGVLTTGIYGAFESNNQHQSYLAGLNRIQTKAMEYHVFVASEIEKNKVTSYLHSGSKLQMALHMVELQTTIEDEKKKCKAGIMPLYE